MKSRLIILLILLNTCLYSQNWIQTTEGYKQVYLSTTVDVIRDSVRLLKDSLTAIKDSVKMSVKINSDGVPVHAYNPPNTYKKVKFQSDKFMGQSNSVDSTILTLSNTSNVFQSPQLGTILHLVSDATANGRISHDTYFNGFQGSNFQGRHARGTSANPTGLQLDDILAVFSGDGYGTTGFHNIALGSISIRAKENYDTQTKGGTYIRFSTSKNGEISNLERARFDDTGLSFQNVTFPIGTSTDSVLVKNSLGQLALVPYPLSSSTAWQLGGNNSGGNALGSTDANLDFVANGSLGMRLGGTANLTISSQILAMNEGQSSLFVGESGTLPQNNYNVFALGTGVNLGQNNRTTEIVGEDISNVENNLYSKFNVVSAGDIIENQHSSLFGIKFSNFKNNINTHMWGRDNHNFAGLENFVLFGRENDAGGGVTYQNNEFVISDNNKRYFVFNKTNGELRVDNSPGDVNSILISNGANQPPRWGDISSVPVVVPFVTATSNYTVQPTDDYIEINTTSAAITVTLPATLPNGKPYRIVWVSGTNPATIESPHGLVNPYTNATVTSFAVQTINSAFEYRKGSQRFQLF